MSFPLDGESERVSLGFGALVAFRERRFAPQQALVATEPSCELITYVREGTLGYEDGSGRTGLLRAGDVLRSSTGGNLQLTQANVSPTHHAHIFQVALRAVGKTPQMAHDRRQFSVAPRYGRLCPVASPDGRLDSVVIQRDAVLYSMLFDTGQHLAHALAEGRSAWLHLVSGEVRLQGREVLYAGDGVCVDAKSVLSMISNGPGELLLLDLHASEPGAAEPTLSLHEP